MHNYTRIHDDTLKPTGGNICEGAVLLLDVFTIFFSAISF